ncbi:MAG TPA: alpha/beta hydrolase [Candidatus Binataceae bacterium]|nr:alpha/beta hydrolase [Candidatus Binataceae bacterium]
MNGPHSHLFHGPPRLHFLEWNPGGRRTVVLVHGNSANAWWWEPVAAAISAEYRLIALDQRGHGDSEWIRPAAYSPDDYADDIARLIEHAIPAGELPVVAGHSMGGLSVLAFARKHPSLSRGIAAIDIAVTSSRARDRYVRRLRALPTVTYPDFEIAKARFRLMPQEGEVGSEILHQIAERSFARTEDGRWTLKFDRESFFGGDGMHVLDTISAIEIPLLLVRAELSRIMTAEGLELAHKSNPRARLLTIPDSYHHLPLERPNDLARIIAEFADSL